MKLNKIFLVVLFLILQAGINSSFAASQCYEIKRKVCNWELAHAGNGQEHRQSISDQYNCELNEQQYSDKTFKIHDDQRSKFSSSEIDNQINYYQEEVSKSKSLGLTTHRDELELCFWQEKKKYYQQGSKANASSNQPSNSGASSSQSNSPQATAQRENSQTNTSQQATTSKKGKKNPNHVSAKCVKLNHDKTKIVNMCSFPINITFCMMHQDDQTIQVTNSCNDGFVTETIYPGRAISDETLNTRLFSTACKHPSVSQNNKYIAFDTPPNGRCSQ